MPSTVAVPHAGRNAARSRPAPRRRRARHAAVAPVVFALALGACGDTTTAPLPPVAAADAGRCSVAGATGCVAPAMLESAAVITLDVAARAEATLDSPDARAAVSAGLADLTVALERQDAEAARRPYRRVVRALARAEADARRRGASDWPDVVAVQLAVAQIGPAIGAGSR